MRMSDRKILAWVIILLMALSVVYALSAPSREAEIAGINTLATELVAKIEAAESENNRLVGSLAATRRQLTAARAENAELQKAVDGLRAWGIDQQTRADNAEVKLSREIGAHAKTKTAYHRLKFALALAGAVLLGIFVSKFAGFLPPPWGLFAPVAGGLLGFGALWILL